MSDDDTPEIDPELLRNPPPGFAEMLRREQRRQMAIKMNEENDEALRMIGLQGDGEGNWIPCEEDTND